MIESKKLITWKCLYCNSVQVAKVRRWEMSYCKCKKSAVDIEEGYTRFIGKVKILKDV